MKNKNNCLNGIHFLRGMDNLNLFRIQISNLIENMYPLLWISEKDHWFMAVILCTWTHAPVDTESAPEQRGHGPPQGSHQTCWNDADERFELKFNIKFKPAHCIFYFSFPNVYFNHSSLYFWVLSGPGSKIAKMPRRGKKSCPFLASVKTRRHRWTSRSTSSSCASFRGEQTIQTCPQGSPSAPSVQGDRLHRLKHCF